MLSQLLLMLWVFIPKIPHKAGLNSLEEALDGRREKKMATEDHVKRAECVLKNNYFEFDKSVY